MREVLTDDGRLVLETAFEQGSTCTMRLGKARIPHATEDKLYPTISFIEKGLKMAGFSKVHQVSKQVNRVAYTAEK